MSKIKLCGLSRREDILAANALRPDFVGFVFAESRRQVTMRQAQELAAELNQGIPVVGVFVNQPEELIAEYLDMGLIHIAQLHGDENEALISRLKQRTAKAIIKAVSVRTKEDILRWQDSMADYLLLDHGKGGTGESFSWNLLHAVGEMKKPYFLAGGLDAENLAAALAYQPYGVDVSSGAETNGQKDMEKMRALVTIVRSQEKKN